MKHTFSGHDFDFPSKVSAAISFGDRQIVILDVESLSESAAARNAFCLLPDGNVLWQIEAFDFPPQHAAGNYWTSAHIDGNVLKISNYLGYTSTIDASSGKIQSSLFTR